MNNFDQYRIDQVNYSQSNTVDLNDRLSTISSTPSEYGSADSAHDSTSSDNQRPVADRDAFIQESDSREIFDHNYNPLGRAKQLAAEMKSTRKERRKSLGEKFLKIGGTEKF